MKRHFISALVFFFLFCTKQPLIDNNLYGTWLYIGYKDMALGKQVDAKNYSVPNSLKAYRIGSNSLTQFTRGVDYSSSPMGGSIEFFDSIQTDDYSVKVTESSISSNEFGKLSYEIRYECSAQFLKLTKNTTSYDPVLGIVPVELSEYCIKVSKDSIPISWPHDEDVIKPDSLCNPNSIMELMNF